MSDQERKTYRIFDRGADYILTHWNGLDQRCPNAAALARAIATAESLNEEMDPHDPETARCVHAALEAQP